MTVWFPPPEEAAALKEAVRLLRQVEWAQDHDEYPGFCPVCNHRTEHTHEADCRLDAFLNRWGTP